jgi:aminoglycoside phosphotransferase (APT) family kinase protein
MLTPIHLDDKFIVRLAAKLAVAPKQLKSLASSRDNSVFLVDGPRKLVARVSSNKPIGDVAQEYQLLQFLHDMKFPCARVVDFFVIECEPAQVGVIVFEYIAHSPVLAVDADIVTSMAGRLAKLHELTADYCRSRVHHQHRTSTGDLDALAAVLNQPQTASNASEFAQAVSWAQTFYANAAQQSHQPLVIHNDYRVQNVLFGADRQICAVIDFDWAVQGFAEKDLAHAAMELAMQDGQAQLNHDYYQLFINAYREASSLGIDYSLESLYNWSRFAALADAAYYFLSYPERTDMRFDSYMYNKYRYFSTLLPTG